MLEERKTHYSDTKYCDRIGENILVEQIRAPGDVIIVKCKYMNLDACDIDINNPRSCPLKLNKLVNVIRN